MIPLFDNSAFNTLKAHVFKGVTYDEMQAYKNGVIKKIYTDLDTLLIDNIKHVDLILRTLAFIYYGVVVINGKSFGHSSYNKPSSGGIWRPKPNGKSSKSSFTMISGSSEIFIRECKLNSVCCIFPLQNYH